MAGKLLFLLAVFLLATRLSHASPHPDHSPAFIRSRTQGDTGSTREEAIRFIEAITHLDTSVFWPHVRPALFLENLRTNIYNPFAMYQGSNTNFCGYAALSYIPLHQDPLGYARFMLELYRKGSAAWKTVFFDPSREIREAAGTLVFKGVLDIRPADQLWFLLLADHFKGYLNVFSSRYHPGDENTFWAAVNFGKFNRMIRTLFHARVKARGADLIRPCIKDWYAYLTHAMETGTTFLYVSNTYLYKKNHHTLQPRIPTHFLVLTGMSRDEGTGIITVTYWDYGIRSLRQLSLDFLKKITFGITYCTKNDYAKE